MFLQAEAGTERYVRWAQVMARRLEASRQEAGVFALAKTYFPETGVQVYIRVTEEGPSIRITGGQDGAFYGSATFATGEKGLTGLYKASGDKLAVSYPPGVDPVQTSPSFFVINRPTWGKGGKAASATVGGDLKVLKSKYGAHTVVSPTFRAILQPVTGSLPADGSRSWCLGFSPAYLAGLFALTHPFQLDEAGVIGTRYDTASKTWLDFSTKYGFAEVTAALADLGSATFVNYFGHPRDDFLNLFAFIHLDKDILTFPGTFSGSGQVNYNANAPTVDTFSLDLKGEHLIYVTTFSYVRSATVLGTYYINGRVDGALSDGGSPPVYYPITSRYQERELTVRTHYYARRIDLRTGAAELLHSDTADFTVGEWLTAARSSGGTAGDYATEVYSAYQTLACWVKSGSDVAQTDFQANMYGQYTSSLATGTVAPTYTGGSGHKWAAAKTKTTFATPTAGKAGIGQTSGLDWIVFSAPGVAYTTYDGSGGGAHKAFTSAAASFVTTLLRDGTSAVISTQSLPVDTGFLGPKMAKYPNINALPHDAARLRLSIAGKPTDSTYMLYREDAVDANTFSSESKSTDLAVSTYHSPTAKVEHEQEIAIISGAVTLRTYVDNVLKRTATLDTGYQVTQAGCDNPMEWYLSDNKRMQVVTAKLDAAGLMTANSKTYSFPDPLKRGTLSAPLDSGQPVPFKSLADMTP